MRLDGRVVTALNNFWWERVPVTLSRISTSFSTIFTDGIYLAAWPVSGAIVPLATATLGLAFGAGLLRASGDLTFTYSIALLVVMVGAGHLGGALGAWLSVGFAIADFLFFPHAGRSNATVFAALTQDYLPLWVSYVVLGILLAVIPPAASRVRDLTIRDRGWERRTRITVGTVLQGGTQAVLTYLWLLAAPALIRPVFTFRNLGTPVEAFRPLQTDGEILVVIAAIAGAFRSAVEAKAFRDPDRADRVGGLLAGLALSAAATPIASLRLARLIGKPLLMTFLLLGVIGSWIEACAVALVLAAITWTQEVWLPSYASRWVERLRRVPFVARFAAGVLISALAVAIILSGSWGSAESSMRPVLYSILFSLGVFALLFPRSDPEVYPAGASAAALGVLVTFALLFTTPVTAYADNCGSTTDCFFGFVGALLATIALILILFLVFFFVVIPSLMSWLDELASGSRPRPSPQVADDPTGPVPQGDAAEGTAASGGRTVAPSGVRGGAVTAEEVVDTRAQQDAYRVAQEAAWRERENYYARKGVANAVQKMLNRLVKDPSGNLAKNTVQQFVRSIPSGEQGAYLQRLLSELGRRAEMAAGAGRADIVRNVEIIRNILMDML